MFKEFTEELHSQCSLRGTPTDIELAMVAQAQLESGTYVDSLLAVDAFNFWGMKCGSSWKGRVYTVETREVVNGKSIDIIADFRMYDDIRQGIWGYFDFLSMSIYENALNSNTAKEFMDKVCRHWASDPSYRAKWEKLYNRLISKYETLPPSRMNYVIGKDYIIIASGLAVRTNVGINYPLVGYENLSEDGKKHDKNKNGYLDKGTVVTVKNVAICGDETWLLVPSGWICATMNGEIYVE